MLNKLGDFFEAFWFAGNEDEAKVGELGYELLVNIEEDFFFIGSCAACDPEFFIGEVELGRQRIGAIDFIGNLGGVVFEGACNDYFFRGTAEFLEMVGVFIGLGEDEGKFFKDRADDGFY